MIRVGQSEPRSRTHVRLARLWAVILLTLSLAVSVAPGARAETDPSVVVVTLSSTATLARTGSTVPITATAMLDGRPAPASSVEFYRSTDGVTFEKYSTVPISSSGTVTANVEVPIAPAGQVYFRATYVTPYGWMNGGTSDILAMPVDQTPRMWLSRSSSVYGSNVAVRVTVAYFRGPVTVSLDGSYETTCPATGDCVIGVVTTPAGAHTITASDGVTTLAAPYTIIKSSTAVTVFCASPSMYTGEPVTPCTATVVGGTLYYESVAVEYANNVAVGTATATGYFPGDANHDGSMASGTFAIEMPTAVTVDCGPGPFVYTGSALTPCTARATGSWQLAPRDVPVTYTDNLNAGTATASASFVGLSGSAQFAIAKAPSTTTVACPASAAYTGLPMTPCSASATGVGMAAVSRTPSYTGNVNVGTATASASWAGDVNHTGSSGTGTFVITKAASTVAVTCPSSPLTYTGSAQMPCTAKATGPGMTDLPLTVTYSANVNAGTATASASWPGSANLSGSNGSAIFQIAKAPSATTVTCTAGPHVYDGAAKTPCTAVAMRVGGSTVPVAVAYTGNVDAGTAGASATWAGDANHLGSSGSRTFAIDRAPVTMSAGDYSGEFDGEAHPLAACVVSGDYVGSLTCVNDPSTAGPAVGSGVVAPLMAFGGEKATNFDVTAVSGQWEVRAAALTVSVGAVPAVEWAGDGNYTGGVEVLVTTETAAGVPNDATLRVQFTGVSSGASATLDCEATTAGNRATHICVATAVDLPLDVYTVAAETVSGNAAGTGYGSLTIYNPATRRSAVVSGSVGWPDGGTGAIALSARTVKKGVVGGVVLSREWTDGGVAHSAKLTTAELSGLTVGRVRIDGGQCRVATVTGVAGYTLDGATETGVPFSVSVTDCAGLAGDRVDVTGPGAFRQASPVLAAGGVLLVNA
ncbi:hypothetical protein [Tessaracoccus sp. G1721]